MSEPWTEETRKRLDEPMLTGRTPLRVDIRAALAEIDRLKNYETLYTVLSDKYMDLVMAVAQKWPEETRHETAKRYIVERESTIGQGWLAALDAREKAGA